MQLPELLRRLQNLQTAANKITITSAALSCTIGEHIRCLNDCIDICVAHDQAAKMQKCLNAIQDALMGYCDAAAALARGDE